ncbi:hypothetical protein CEXT_473511 [Caerostris extrusa]|uniref:Uncharacterized protein n=1 Tax=Caerostris extrusa TaxID=172846 RepID=A0AAV4V584_CAEEX|nr:hypothetical protein CEXT_473511 [Caerostris extrusa]
MAITIFLHYSEAMKRARSLPKSLSYYKDAFQWLNGAAHFTQKPNLPLILSRKPRCLIKALETNLRWNVLMHHVMVRWIKAGDEHFQSAS